MPKLTPEDKTPVTEYKVRLRTDVQAQIECYGQYLNSQSPSSPGYVITESFRALIAGDKAFADFWEKSKDQVATPKGEAKRGRPAMAKTAGE